MSHNRRDWTADEDSKLKKMWSTSRASDLGKIFGCSGATILRRGRELGMRGKPLVQLRGSAGQVSAAPPRPFVPDDTRSRVELMLGDPMPGRSALDQMKAEGRESFW